MSKKKAHLPGPKGDPEQARKMREHLDQKRQERRISAPHSRPEIKRVIRDGHIII